MKDLINKIRNALGLWPECLGCGERHEGALTHKKLKQIRKAQSEQHMMVGPGHPLHEALMEAFKGTGEVQFFEKGPDGQIRKATKH